MKMLLDGATATVTGKTDPDARIQQTPSNRVTVQVSIVGTSGTVKVYGRLADNLPWFQVGTDFTASDVIESAWLHEWKAEITAISSATVDVAISGETN